ncbi:beta-defensin 33-like [Nannospalax galili]|uniref:Defensin beta 33 n=1 Tax=Nannospalax galili TaxID=1026970 RepID=A0A8C6QCH4_NANGA|nr:beta-defensin 33-like [Nannospalax galili]
MRLLFLLVVLLICLTQTTSGHKRNSKSFQCKKMGGACKSQKTHGCSILPVECRSRFKHCCRL